MTTFTIIYGSETGQSEAIAEQIYGASVSHGLEPRLVCGSEVKSDELLDQTVLFVVSSTGDGDPPENFESFWLALQAAPPQHLNYTLLGLGDSNYSSFGGFPTELDTFLNNNGGRNFYKFELADDAVGLEIVVEPWIDGLWDHLTRVISEIEPENDLIQSLNQLKIDCSKIDHQKLINLTYNIEFTDGDFEGKFPCGVEEFILPFSCGVLEEVKVCGTRRLSEEDMRVKNVAEMTLETKTEYGPGDSFGILPQNSDHAISSLLTRLGLTSSQHLQYTLTSSARIQPKHILKTCSIYYALKYTLDIFSLPKKAMLRYLAQNCKGEKERDLLYYLASTEGSKDLNVMIYNNKMSLLEILNIVPSCDPHFVGLLQFLPRLMPRYYSVSKYTQTQGEPLVMPNVISFAFTVVDNIRPESLLEKSAGVCTSWLSNVNVGEKVFIYKRANDHFKPKQSDVIMIGAGTGVAPFLSFLQHLSQPIIALPKTSEIESQDHMTDKNQSQQGLLITGNRYQDLDSIYKSYFQQYLTTHILSDHFTAYSRDDVSRYHYVQDCIADNSKLIIDLVDKGAAVFVCGDAKGLAKGVEDMFVKVLMEVKGVSEDEAKIRLKRLRDEKLYLEDIW